MKLKPIVGLYGVLEKTEEGWNEAGSLLKTVQKQLSVAGLNVRPAPELWRMSQRLSKRRIFSIEKIRTSFWP